MENNEIEIAFGAKDSELIESTYHIPGGMEAIIEGDKVIIRKKESEDEKTRKEIYRYLYNELHNIDQLTPRTNTFEMWLAWLEKQKSVGEIVERCKASWYNEGKIQGQIDGLSDEEKYQQGWHDALEKLAEPNWCHHKVDLSGYSEEYRKAYYDGWNNCNMQHSQCNVEKNDVIKCLINGMKFYYEYNKDATWGTDKWSMPVKHIIDVLEKQGEKTVIGAGSNSASVSDGDTSVTSKEVVSHPTTSTTIKPKFKVGDFIMNDYCMGRVIELTNDAYLLDTEQGIPFSYEHNVHLWSIEDAKDGDVLAGKIDGDNYILIYKQIKEGWIETYGHYYDAVDRFCVPSQLFCRDYKGTFYPATKEQRDLLFSKMKEAGYEWDAEKKELKKITKFKVGDTIRLKNSLAEYTIESISDGRYYFKGSSIDIIACDHDYELAVPNLANLENNGKEWGEENKNIIKNISHIIREYDKITKRANQPCWYIGDCLLWLQDIELKGLPQSKQDWSEEDEEKFRDVIRLVEQGAPVQSMREHYTNWLKSLKERYTWKPSDEQMTALEYYMHALLATEHKEVLFGLYNDLKKLIK